MSDILGSMHSLPSASAQATFKADHLTDSSELSTLWNDTSEMTLERQVKSNKKKPKTYSEGDDDSDIDEGDNEEGRDSRTCAERTIDKAMGTCQRGEVLLIVVCIHQGTGCL